MRAKEDAQKIVAPDGVEIYYWTTYEPSMDKEFYVMHPPTSMNHSSLAKLEKMLNDKGHPTLIFDPRGSGYSGHPIPKEYYELERMSGDLGAIIQKEGILNPNMLAYSFGMMITADYVAKRGNVNKIVGVCGSHNFEETAPNKTLFHLFDKLLIYSEFAGSSLMYLNHLFKGEQRTVPDQEQVENDFQVWCSIVDIPYSKVASHVWGQRTINTWDVSEQLRNIDVPMTLFYGANDPMVRPHAGQMIEELTQGQCDIHIIDGATHSLPILHPEKIIEKL